MASVLLSAGARLGPYEILGPLGAGGMGEVYRARDTRLGRVVAVKVLPESLASDPDHVARFEREARAVAALSHANILVLFDIGRQDDTVFVVTERLEGETLRERLHRVTISVPTALDYAAQVARGLAAAHELGIVHRDLKPENLFVTREGRVKILDFGLAKFALPGDDKRTITDALTRPGTVLGTVGYMAPEQVRGESVDARADIFSLGAILYEMLSGRRAFDAPTPAETLSAILRDEPRELTEANPGISPALGRLLDL